VHPDDFRWRFGSVGLASGYLVTPLIGDLLLIMGTCLIGHRSLNRALAFGNLFVVLLLTGLLLVYSLDVLQLRATIAAESMGSIEGAAARAALKLFILLIAYSWLSLEGFRLSRKGGDSKHGSRSSNEGMLVTGARNH
jgi:hypothetical protein